MVGTFPKVRLVPLRRQGRALQLGWARGRVPLIEKAVGRALRLGLNWEVAAWEIAHLGSFHLGNYPYEVTIWGTSLRKVPNIL